MVEIWTGSQSNPFQFTLPYWDTEGEIQGLTGVRECEWQYNPESFTGPNYTAAAGIGEVVDHCLTVALWAGVIGVIPSMTAGAAWEGSGSGEVTFGV